MKKITEQQLLESTRALRDYMTNLSEAPSDMPWLQNAADMVGTVTGGTAGLANYATDQISKAGKKFSDTFNTAFGGKPTGTSAAMPQSAAAPAATTAAAQTSAWPTTPDAIKAFQQAHGLKADGIIGNNTYGALVKQGLTPPAGFKPVGNKPTASTPATSTAPAAPTTADANTGVNPAIEKTYTDNLSAAAEKYRTYAKQQLNMKPEEIEKKVRELFPQLPIQPAAKSAAPTTPGINPQAASDALNIPFASTASAVKEDQTLARIIELARR